LGAVFTTVSVAGLVTTPVAQDDKLNIQKAKIKIIKVLIAFNIWVYYKTFSF